ncbi:MAG: sigma 54-interacting transcriptional regulator [Candidatus Rokuibacteriota bacterium]
MARHVLIAGFDRSFAEQLTAGLVTRGCRVTETSGHAAAVRVAREQPADLVIVGPDEARPADSLATALALRRHDERVPIILVTPTSSEEQVITALRARINDYLKSPVSAGAVLASAERCAPALVAARGELAGNGAGPVVAGGERLIGESEAARNIRAAIARIGASDSNVLITGETGTGKELVARLVHRNSRRSSRPFVVVNCAAIPETLLESELFGHERGAFTGASVAREGALQQAAGGTIFFDEIGDLPVYGQAKILRTIEQKEIQRLGGRPGIPIDVRVIAATNQDLEQAIAERRFRSDLYFRLNVARIHVPPLRERREDLGLLLAHYIGQLNERFERDVEGVTAEAIEVLLRHDWPGNVREVKNMLEAIFVNVPPRGIGLGELPEPFQRRLPKPEERTEDECARLLAALFATNWNKSRAAARLNWSRMTVYRKIARYRLVRAPAAGRGVPAVSSSPEADSVTPGGRRSR